MLRILILLFVISISCKVLAADLIEGQWDGKVTLHGKKPAKAKFHVRSKGNDDEMSYKIEMFHIERPYKFEDLTVGEKSMKFVFNTGDEYECLLHYDEKEKKNIEECKDREGYCGKCIFQSDDEIRNIIINMLPPIEEAEAPEQDNAEAKGEPLD
jgi:hypothetical protein